jgi:H+/Cl- antiporter ClcA
MSAAIDRLRDYSVDARVLYVSVLAAVLGAVSSVLAWALLELISLATNLFYYHRFSFADVEPSGHHLGWWAIFMPVIGGLIVGLIARYGSSRVRGHGMPEAVEVIVFQRGRVQPRVAILKPLATAISIGSGGPFGAEGPVIITGGAVGSVLGQLLPVTDSERTVLMVAGASAGMAAAFSCPMSATLLAVELLLFEWRPRSLVPVAIACITAGAIRRLLLGPGPIFLMQPTVVAMHHAAMAGALVMGVLAALMATGLSRAIHFFETTFESLPIHWMWWPAIGGIVVGLGGLIFPQALGVGYDVIRMLLNDQVTWKLLTGILVIKSLIWVVSLGSETAGGILAPLLMIAAPWAWRQGMCLLPSRRARGRWWG